MSANRLPVADDVSLSGKRKEIRSEWPRRQAEENSLFPNPKLVFEFSHTFPAQELKTGDNIWPPSDPGQSEAQSADGNGRWHQGQIPHCKRAIRGTEQHPSGDDRVKRGQHTPAGRKKCDRNHEVLIHDGRRGSDEDAGICQQIFNGVCPPVNEGENRDANKPDGAAAENIL